MIKRKYCTVDTTIAWCRIVLTTFICHKNEKVICYFNYLSNTLEAHLTIYHGTLVGRGTQVERHWASPLKYFSNSMKLFTQHHIRYFIYQYVVFNLNIKLILTIISNKDYNLYYNMYHSIILWFVFSFKVSDITVCIQEYGFWILIYRYYKMSIEDVLVYYQKFVVLMIQKTASV